MQPQKNKILECRDCGNAQVNHFAEKLNAVVEEISLPFSIASIRISSSFLKFLAAAHIGKIIDMPDDQTGGRARCIWLEAKRRGIYMWEFRPFGISREIFVAEIPERIDSETGLKTGVRTIVFDGLPRPALTLSGKKHPPASLAWVDNKPTLKKKFAAEDIPVARGATAFTQKKALEIFGQLNKPLIVKPSTGSRSRHTTVHVGDEKTLIEAFVRAKRLSPRVVIEEELAGDVYRGTVIGGKVIGIRRKEPPYIIGDGIRTLRELIEIENRQPERQGPIYTRINTENLRSDIDFKKIPKKGERIILSDKTAIALGGGSTDVTDIAHPDFISLLEKIAVTLDDHLVGADFITLDITRPLSDQPHSGVIECNSLPFIDVHLFPLDGKPRDTASALWDAVVNPRFF